MVIKLGERKFLHGRPRPLLWPKILTRMLTRDLFAVANLIAHQRVHKFIRNDVNMRIVYVYTFIMPRL